MHAIPSDAQSSYPHNMHGQAATSSSSSSSSSASSAVRRCGDDARLRPFLSSRFDMQGYIHNILKEGRSEECFAEISSSIDEVNSEIKGYISAHKSDLMSGMQDVAILSERYNNLTLVSEELKSGVVKMKKDVADSHGQIKSKIRELERIHETSLALRYLRQFVHSTGQLDHFLKSTEDDKEKKTSVTRDSIQIQNSHFDVRNLASVAKIINELELIIENPILKGIKEVANHAASVKNMGVDLRKGTQSILFSALKNRNQSIIGACLQIFYHLQSLPEIILLIIDKTVKESVDIIQATLDIDALVRSNPDLNSTAAVQAYGTKGAAVPHGGAVPTAPSGIKQVNTILTIPFPNSAPIASAVRDFATGHASALDDQTMVVYILQKVLLKKEDPSTHQKFVDVIRTLLAGNNSNSNNSNSNSNSNHSNNSNSQTGDLNASYRDLLGQGHFVDLFWERLGTQFQDILNHKLRSHPIALSRLYPSFRRLAVDSMMKFQRLTKQDAMSKDDLRLQLSFSSGGDHQDSTVFYPDQVYDPSVIAAFSNQNENHMFGSLVWGQNQYTDIYKMSRRGGLDGTGESTRLGGHMRSDSSSSSSGLLNNADSFKNHSSTSSSSSLSSHGLRSFQSDSGLLMCYSAVRDRYLIGSLSRMTYPILQMFPEVDGYTAAIPSKNDIQKFFKAVNTELVTACVEGDSSLLQLVGKEALKAIQLMLSKLEAMVVLSGPDFAKIAPTAASTFAKNSSQEHNGQLINILISLRDSLEKLPENISRQIQSESISSTFYSSDSGSGSANTTTTIATTSTTTSTSAPVDIAGAMAHLVGNGISQVEDLVSKQLLRPLTDNVMAYIRGHLLGLLREGLTTSSSSSSSSSSSALAQSGSMLVECSRAILLIQKQLPELMKTYYSTLSPSLCVVNSMDELFQRLMVTYISLAAATRPVSEHVRLRVAKDLSALEDAISSVISSLSSHNTSGTSAAASSSALKQLQQKYFSSDTTCQVSLEFRSLKRLLFIESEQQSQPQASATTSARQAQGQAQAGLVVATPPTKGFLLSQPFIAHIRPSTLIAHLIASAPSLLPSPWEASDAKYFEALTKVVDIPSSSSHRGRADNAGGLRGSARDAADVGRSFYALQWKSQNSVEGEVWTLVQQSLDIFLQRISVADESQRAGMQAWYDLIFDLGGHLFK